MTYNPSNPMFTGSNKSYATQGKPDTAKQWYADSVTFENRPFTSRAEVLAYFDTALKRKGVTGAVVVEAGIPSEYWWPDITKLTDSDLIKKVDLSNYYNKTETLGLIANEATLRQAGDEVLSEDIDQETADRIAADLLKEDKSNKVQTLAGAGSVTYPSTAAVAGANAALDAKIETERLRAMNAESSLADNILLNAPRISAKVFGTGTTSVTMGTDLIGLTPTEFIDSGSIEYTVAVSVSDVNKTVTYNPTTRVVTFPNVVTSDQFIYARSTGGTGANIDFTKYDLKERANTHRSLFYDKGGNFIYDIRSGILSWSGTLFIYNGHNGSGTLGTYIRITANQTFDVTSAIGVSTANNWLCYLKVPDDFMNGTGVDTELIKNPSNFIFINTTDPTLDDFRQENSVLLFTYNRTRNAFYSPFQNNDLNFATNYTAKASDLATQTKLFYTHRGDLIWNPATKIFSWSDSLFIFNHTKVGTGAAPFIRIPTEGGDSFYDIGAAAAEGAFDFWTIYYYANLAFVEGNTTANFTVFPSSFVAVSYNSEGVNTVRDPRAIVLFHYNRNTNRISTPFAEEDVINAFFIGGGGGGSDFNTQKNQTEYFNRYPQLNDRYREFIGRCIDTIGRATTDVTDVLFYGDSIIAQSDNTSELDVDPVFSNPAYTTKTIIAYCEEGLKANKPTYTRFDSGDFTETGTFTTISNDAQWDYRNTRPAIGRGSVTPLASVAFTVEGACNTFNFLDITDRIAPLVVSVSVTEGNNMVQARIQGESTWNEANGYSYSQRHVNPTTRIGDSLYSRRIEYRKTGVGIDNDITITLTKANDATRFLYIGLEKIYGDNKPYVRFTNVARGGKTLEELYEYIDDDFYGRNPNFSICEIPLINMVNENPTIDYCVNQVWDFYWGDRPGFENTWNMKTRSNNWTDFQILLVIPTFPRAHFNTSGEFIDLGQGYTGLDLYSAVKGFIFRKGDVGMIDWSSAQLAEIASDPSYPNNYLALTGSGEQGNSYCNDQVHPNDKCVKNVEAKNLVPFFYFNTL